MQRILIIGHVWPDPTSTAAGTRMLQLIKFFRSRGFSIYFVTTAEKTSHGINLQEYGVETQKIKLNHSDFEEDIKKIQPDFVLFDRFISEEQFGWRISEIFPEAVKILDTEDLHFLRKARKTALNSDLDLKKIIFDSEVAKREVASIYRCDLSLIISETELKFLQEQLSVPLKLLFYLPFLPEEISEEKIKQVPSFRERKDFISIGNFKHEPNWDAVLNLKENIWPLIKKEIPEAELFIFGAYPPPKAFQLHDKKNGFLFMGKAESAEEVFLKARVLLAPLRFGAGLKGKLLDSMLFGTPSVTTNIGAEGMIGNVSWNGFIEDDPEDFATAAVELYQNEEKWRSAQKKGFQILKEKFPKEKYEEIFHLQLKKLKLELKEHRLSNFTGAMLSHHSLSSMKYLAKYIALKNKEEI